MNKRLRIGVIGAGNIARIAQLPSLVARDDVDLISVVTRTSDPAPLQRRWGFTHAFRSTEDMLAGPSLDAAFVLTPRDDHADSVRVCLAAGLDVFCEKPLATRARTAHQLADLAEESGRVLLVGLNRRFATVYAAGRATFGADGAAFCVAQKHRFGSEYRATFENAVHMVDLLRWYCGGTPVTVAATALGSDPWEEDGVSALVTFDNGHCGQLVAARNAGGWEESLDAYGGGSSVHVEAPERVSITTAGKTTSRQMRQEAFGWATATESFGFRAAVDHFLDRVRDREEGLTSGREAALTQDLVEKILSAAGLPTDESPDRAFVSHSTQ